jgi:glutamate synthase domain-containing protein 2
MSRYPLEGYRERCGTDVVLGDRFAKYPLHLDIPVTIAGMSFGALSGPAKEALGRGASDVGTSTTTGDGGMTPEERGQSKYLVYQYLPSRYGVNPDDLRKADAIEVVLGQGAKPGGGGMLLGQKISERVAGMRTLPEGIDQRSACRHPDWTGPDDLTIKINELREITDWEKPIYVKVGATRTYYDVKLAVHAGADVVVVDGMQGGTAATQEVFIEHVGIPTLAAVPQAVQALAELGVHRKVQLIVSGGIRTGADVAKALALGADAVAIGTAALIALGDNHPRYAAEYEELGSAAGFFDDFQDGTDPSGISTQDPELAARFDPVEGGRPQPFADMLANHMASRPNLGATAGVAATPWLFPSSRPGRHLAPNFIMSRLRNLGINLLAARNTALQSLVAEAPPPRVAELLGYSYNTTQRHAQIATQPWARYATKTAAVSN